MKKLLIGLLSCWLASQAGAAQPEWLTDLPKAQAKAKAEGKHLLLDFGDSDTCILCKVFEKKVASTKEFEAYAKTNLVLVEVDFSAKKKLSNEQRKANFELLEKFKVADKDDMVPLPTFILLDREGKEVGRQQSYDPETKPGDFIKLLENWKKK